MNSHEHSLETTVGFAGMKKLFFLLLSLPLLAAAQSKQKTAYKATVIPAPKFSSIQPDVREIGGTNYQVHMLEHWLVNTLTNARPLVN